MLNYGKISPYPEKGERKTIVKKLMFAAVLACSMVVVADDAAKPEAKAAAPAAEAAQAVRAKRPQMTPEQRAEMRAKREKFMAERRAKMEAKAVEIIKKYGLDDEKAKALFNELQDAMRAGFMGHRPRPNAAKPASVKKAE